MSRNPIWEYFSKIETDSSKAQCHECRKLYSLGSKIPRKQTTHGLKSHLEKCHNPGYIEYISKLANRENGAKKPKLEDSFGTTSNSFSPQNIPLMKEKESVWSDEHPSAKRIDKCIMDLIIVEMLPYTVVESEAFRRLNFADPADFYCYKLKSENYFRTTLMPATYNIVVAHVKKLLKKADWVSLTIDEWTNKKKSTLINFTGHFINRGERHKVVLNSMVFDEDLSGIYLSTKLKEAINYWNLIGKVHLGIRDNTASMIRAMEAADISDLRCMSQVLQQIIHDSIFTQPLVDNLIIKARQIVNHFRQNDGAHRSSENYQNSSNSLLNSLIVDENVRWYNKYMMLESLAEQRRLLSLYNGEQEDIKPLSAAEWDLINGISAILKPFHEATIEICSENACVSIVIPILAMLVKKLEPADEGIELWRMKAAIRDALKRRFDLCKKMPSMISATLLDPRFKEIYLGTAECESGKEEILEFLRLKNAVPAILASVRGNEKTEISQQTNLFSDKVSSSESPSNLWDAHDNIGIETLKQTTTNQISEYAQRQLLFYLRQPRVPRTTNIYEFWNSGQFPALEAAARKYLSAPPTNHASNQLLNTIGQIYSDRSNNLCGENVEKHLFMACNIRLLGFDY